MRGLGWGSRPTRSLATRALATNKHNIDKKLAVAREAAAKRAEQTPQKAAAAA